MSMADDGRLGVLRLTFANLARRAEALGGKFALASWDAWVEFCAGEAWLTRFDDAVHEWMVAQRPRGGNDMRHAFEETMRAFSDATDVWIMCDGAHLTIYRP